LNGPKAEGKKITINWNFTDIQKQYVLNLENSALTYVPNKQAKDADVGLTLSRLTLNEIILKQLTIPEALQSGKIIYKGNLFKLGELFSLLDEFQPTFEIMEPKKQKP
jgi:alkyl sulfatase BDS1-like metallo-beta-lactamase superfamily hydrolase